MKWILLLLVLSFTQLNAQVVEEGFWINNSNATYLNLLKSRPELTIDHVHPLGFEVYGPKGLKEFLERNQIDYVTLDDEKADTTAGYPTFSQIEAELKDLASRYPDICDLQSIGKSVRGKDLWVMKIASLPRETNDTRPEFKYIANMHGNEIVGRELMLRLIKDLLFNYGKDSRITSLIETTQIYIMVSMNPDGAELGRRGNANSIDLNRSFPDFSTRDNVNNEAGRAPETQAVMRWQRQHHFRLSANFHGGAEVVNYPWDTTPTAFEKEALVKDLSLEYATLATYIGKSTFFEKGIVNGYRWYEVDGGMQDWSIYYHQDLQLTIELSNDKWPSFDRINYYYGANREALIRFIERIHTI